MSQQHTPNSYEGTSGSDAPAPKVISMRRWSHDPDNVVRIVLLPRVAYRDSEEVASTTDFDACLIVPNEIGLGALGHWIGTVGSYTGSLDRKAGRLRIPGKRRTLWNRQAPAWDRPSYGSVSRAEAIRDLLRVEEDRARQEAENASKKKSKKRSAK